ncbi:MAG TPA: hypothetical protein PKC71_12825, partial [Ottowia sp.]|nr:hypothetical protein [Ottowia sp.]
MMAITTSISIRVKPRAAREAWRRMKRFMTRFLSIFQYLKHECVFIQRESPRAGHCTGMASRRQRSPQPPVIARSAATKQSMHA